MNGVLREAWERGMRQSNSPLAKEVSEELNISLQKVKVWIGNYRRVVEGRVYKKPKPHYKRGISAYNVFCMEKAKETGPFVDFSQTAKDWGTAWAGLSDTEKSVFQAKSQSVDYIPTDVPPSAKEKKSLIRELQRICNVLSLHNVEVFAVGIDTQENSSFRTGSSRGMEFLEERPILETEFMSKLCHVAEGKNQKKTRAELRKIVQDILNQKYSEAIGRKAHVPYKDVLSGKINIKLDGLPNIQLVHPSNYGIRSLETIVAGANDFNFAVSYPSRETAELQETKEESTPVPFDLIKKEVISVDQEESRHRLLNDRLPNHLVENDLISVAQEESTPIVPVHLVKNELISVERVLHPP